MFLLTLPLIGLTGLWQFPIFYGMNLPHECHETNQTFHRHLVDNYTDCMMESTYTSEFEELFELYGPCNMGHIIWLLDSNNISNGLKLYCDKKHIAPLLASAANIGGLAGHLIWGVCQDWFGRRKTNIFCSLMTFLFSLSLCFVPQYSFNGKLPEYSLFLLIRFFFGLCANGMGSYTLPVELGKSSRHGLTNLPKTLSIIKKAMDGRPVHGNGLGFGYILAPCFRLSFPQLERCNAHASRSTLSLLALSLAVTRITKMAAQKK